MNEQGMDVLDAGAQKMREFNAGSGQIDMAALRAFTASKNAERASQYTPEKLLEASIGDLNLSQSAPDKAAEHIATTLHFNVRQAISMGLIQKPSDKFFEDVIQVIQAQRLQYKSTDITDDVVAKLRELPVYQPAA